MARIARIIRARHNRRVEPSMVMIDAQTVRGGRAGPTFHNAGGRGGRTIGAKRRILIEILGLPLAVRVDPAKPHACGPGASCSTSACPTCPTSRRSWPTAAIGASRPSPPRRV
jgi:hypothetical protein